MGELQDKTVDELRDAAKREGVEATSGMRKDELIKALEQRAGARGDAGGDDRQPERDKEPRGDSDAVRYGQAVTSPDEEPEREGRSLVTRSHEVIRQWAEERDAAPATVEGSWHDDRPGVLRFDFGGDSDRLEHVEWEQWFRTFDERGLNFIYQETKVDGATSNFFRLENPDREDG